MQYRKRPVVIDAVQWDGDNFDAVLSWAAGFPPVGDQDLVLRHAPDTREILIPTLEGIMVASAGDWIIRGVAGELYPCKPTIFAATYEPAA